MWDGKTRFIAHCPWSPDTRLTQIIAHNMSTHQVRRHKHLHVPQLLNRLGLPHKAVLIPTHSIHGQVITHVMQSCKTVMTVQYMVHSAPVQGPEVLVVPRRAYDPVLGLLWFRTCKLEISWATGPLTSLGTPSGHGETCWSGMIVQRYECQDDDRTNVQLPDISGSTPMMNSTSDIPTVSDGKPRERGEDSSTPDIEILGATAFYDLITSNETIKIFSLRIGECSWLLVLTMEVTTLEGPGENETINPKR